MNSSNAKSLLLAGVLSCAVTTACMAQTYSGYWVVGNGAIHSCEIVTDNPVIDYTPGSFGSGPYRSREMRGSLAPRSASARRKNRPSPGTR